MDRYFLLLGQSNMSGRGQPLDQTNQNRPLDNVLTYSFEHNCWIPGRDPLQPINDPIFSVKADRVGGVGPGLSFAQKMLSSLSGTVGLLLCAKGGTSIKSWQPNGVLYSETIRRAQSASKSAELAGVLIYLGESDTSNFHDASHWPELLIALCSNLRNDLGGKLPIVFAQLATVTPQRKTMKEHGYIAWDHLKDLQAKVCINLCEMIKTDDLPLNPDGLHVSADGQRICGERFAEKMLYLLSA